MSGPNIVVDTNVLIAALRSDRGSSNELLLQSGDGEFKICLSVALMLEYEDVCKRQASQLSLTLADIDDILDYIYSVSELTTVHFRWRPSLSDPGDDMILELAVASRSSFIVTFNARDFTGTQA
ncbi:MAG: putative toxin-antitoxin system toxin component, PIN family, partial [Pirellulaceae bacterium]|nr:putative toxin-antitoxin system toxin component, PIN family [Pirellulaceae bacterium]